MSSGVGAPVAQAGPFLPPQRVINQGPYSELQDLAVGPGGAAAFSFVRVDGLEQLFIAVHDQGSLPTPALPRAFTLAEPVTPPASYVHASKLGIDAAGNMTVVYWTSNADFTGVGDVYSRYRRAGGAWSEPQRLGALGHNWESEIVAPELAVASTGRAYAMFDAGLFERAPGATTFTPVPGTADVRHIAVNPAGDLVATFERLNTPCCATKDLTVQVRPAGGAWSAPEAIGLVEQEGHWPEDRSAVALTANRTVVLAWDEGAGPYDSNAPDHGLNVSVRTPGSTFATGTWTTTQDVASRGPGDFGAFRPNARVETSGKVAIGWSEAPPTGFGVPEGHEQVFPGGGPSVPNPSYDLIAASPAANGRALMLAGPVLIGMRVRSRFGEAFGPAQPVIVPTGTETYSGIPRMGLDDQGNGYIAWRRFYPAAGNVPPKWLFGVSGYDPVSPKITAVGATEAKVGQPVVLTATATDRMSTPKLTWTFGDGSPSTTGSTANHTYKAAGTYTAKVSARDEAGNSTSWPKTIVVR